MGKLYRVASWYRPLHITRNGKELKLSNIIVYDNKGIIVETGYGYFDNDKEIEIGGEILLKRKEDFTKTTNFIMSDKKNWDNETEYKLYIHKDNIDFEFTGLSKSVDMIMQNYIINGGEFSRVFKYLGDNKIKYQTEFREELESLHNRTYSLPFKQEELEEIFENLLEKNRKILAEKESINNFDLETLKEEEQKIIERIKE